MAGRPLLILLFALSAIVAAMVAVVGWRRRHAAPAVGALAFLAAGIAGWSAADALLTLTAGAEIARVLQAVKFLAIGAVPAGLCCLSLAVVDRRWRPSRRTIVLLGIEPVLLLAAIVTNPWHYRFFLATDWADPYGTSTPQVGPLFWAHTSYSYLLLAAAVVRLMQAWIKGPRAQRGLYGAILAGAFAPIAANVASLAGLVQVTGLTSVGFCVTAVIIYWTLVRRSLPELVPVARERVFDMIGDVVATIDASGRILDLNAAAERMLRQLAHDLPDRLIGLSLADMFGGLPPAGGGETEVSLTDGAGREVDLNVRASVLHDRRGGHAGWAVLARDVTVLNRQRRDLEHANAQLLQQRTELEQSNTRLHDKQQELEAVNGRLHDKQRQLEQSNTQLHEKLRTIELLRADLVEQATRDALTGLHNRRHLMEGLRQTMAAAVAGDQPLSLALLDIDHFKQVNDRYGHRAGDEVLIAFARLLGGEVRRSDIVARYGGEEFVVVFPGASADQARARVNALRERVAGESVHADGRLLQVTFSAGVAALAPGHSPDDLLQAADQALYAAKHGGRNQVRVAGEPEAGAPPSAA
ncbi:diguanylate cyclase [Planomonospora sp. ID67723]|uniref:diguanylate cyclase n=1 Tax=Planomonospora sp. ID67723 TaxID=2738134 RepID=UPI0018C3BFBE|nr:diguanylate cyclase [Planomonospora sp. ID67723]MBG0831347.1 diguanylate cyclase [Planomonospora sp. ID67723]